MRKPTLGQRRGAPVRPEAGSGQPGRKRHSRLDANFPEARGSIAGKDDGGKRWQKRVRPGAASKSAASSPGTEDRKFQKTRKLEVEPGTPRKPFRATPRTAPTGRPSEVMRIAKAMARAGLCSRREAERWIGEGRVQVNGQKIASPALDVGPRDRIVVDGEPMPDAEPARLWRYHKPRGLVTTHKDHEGRPTVFDHLPPDLPWVVSVGRLDFNTEGLLLLTNDGELARHMELPATGWLRRYRVRAHGNVTQQQLDALKDGIEIEGVRYGPIEATLDSVQGTNRWLTLGLREGKNREVRNILRSLDLVVNRLIRVSFGPFQLLDLEESKAESVKRRVLADQLGPELANTFGLDAVPPELEKGRHPKSRKRDADDDRG